MKKTFVFGLLLAAMTTSVYAQGSIATGQAASDAGAFASTGAITFEAAEPLRTQRVHTTPNVYAPPATFGGANNCFGSNSFGVGVTGFGFGGALANESDACNAREDTTVFARFGLMDVALIRFACFGEDTNRKAYEAAGYACPSSGTAKGIEGAPTGSTFIVAKTVPASIRMRINQDGTVSQVN